MKRFTGNRDKNNRKIYVGDIVRVGTNAHYKDATGAWLSNGYEGTVEDNEEKDDRYRIIHYNRSLRIDSSLAWECSELRRRFIEVLKTPTLKDPGEPNETFEDRFERAYGSFELCNPICKQDHDRLLAFFKKERLLDRKETTRNLIIIRDTEAPNGDLLKSRAAYNINLLINELSGIEGGDIK